MESCDSSPEYTRATTNSDGKKENSPCGSECDETLSLTSSTRGSEVNGLPVKYYPGIKNRTNKKTLKNFRNLKTFRRRARSRAGDRIFMDMSDDVVTPPPKFSLQVSDETPHYMQATSCSKGKKANFQEIHQNSEICFDNSDLSTFFTIECGFLSVGSMQTSSTALNLRNVKILIKFAKRVELVSGETEPEKISLMKVCRYHHCSLRGHCDEAHDAVHPQKRLFSCALEGQGIVCLKCSCIKRQPNEYKRTAYVDFPHPQVPDSNLGDGYNHETHQSGAADFSDSNASAISLKLDEQISAQTKDTTTSSRGECDFMPSNMLNALTRDNFDEVIENNKAISPSSDNTHFHEENKPLFSKVRHISMWNLIHQQMPLHGGDGSNVLPAKESSQLHTEFSDVGIVNSDHETQDVEVRKLFAVKLVREAIEKILLPEVQDQTYDNQSTMSETTHEPKLFEKNQDEGGVQESSRECEPDKEEGNAPADLKELGVADTDISGQEIVQTDKKFGSRSKKKAPKHWSNLKKWILLQRFIKEIEKVMKFNPRIPKHLPLKPEPDSEKVNLWPQTMDERKKIVEWMLDYALCQAVSQLAPTQKGKVSFLVKAFETVVTLNEDNSQKFAGITHEVDETVYDDEVENCNELSKISNGDYFPKSGHDLGKENRVPSHLNSAFTKTDAIKLVQEVVDEILLPEVQDDSSDTQSVTSDFSRDQEISESLDQEKETQSCEGGISVGQKGLEQKSARKTESLKSKNWSKLNKLILLQRSIKALEKARKLKLRPPSHLSIMPDIEQET
ncbi:calmodulin binding PICBP-like [Olea europaea subsp. europaea]|uniref:Calmodulin binding PICBP-like n=1 Tax=Olea europaea subsp. europaea TaxID=158383 RepID=A0A8S0VNX4_OLEEU|nr:calmodulin binding PICBP-like [Olea europaea subsp. europaea]